MMAPPAPHRGPMGNRSAVLLHVCLLAVANTLPAQETNRLTWDLVLEQGPRLAAPPPPARWIPGTDQIALERRDGDAARNPLLLRLSPGAEPQVVADARTALAALGAEPPDDADAAWPPWSWHDDATLRLQHGNAVFHWRPGKERATAVLALPDGAADAAFAAGDARVAFRLGHDLHVLDRATGLRRLTWDGSPDLVYGGAAHRAEFGIQRGLHWSGDGRRLAFYREDQRPIAPTPLLDLSANPPTPVAGRYPVAGSAHSRVRVGIYDAAERALCWLETDPDADQYWTNLTFSPDGSALYVALVDRGQDRMTLARFDAGTGARQADRFVEQDPRWIEPEHGPTFLDDGRFLWLSPRDGHRHLYLYAADGTLLGQVTRGAFDVHELLGVAADGGSLWFHAAGEDPRQRHLFHASLDGGNIRQVTRERGSHDCVLSPDRTRCLDTWSRIGKPPARVVIDLATGATTPLPPIPDPLQDLVLPKERRFQVTAEDGTVLYGSLLLPPDLPEGARLPVLLYVYGGPHLQLVTDRWLGGAAPWLHALAMEGYVVCRLDNRGTPHRGRAFEQVLHRSMGTIEVQDQLLAVEHLKTLPFVDPDRIGVHGWSYGGYMTLRLLLLAPETFACGVSGAPVTDWALYETGYTERYLDTPAENPDGYAQSSCIPLAGALRRPLLVVHPTDDRTVIWAHTLRFVDACIEAGTFPEYMPYPMQQHGLKGGDRTHFLRLLRRYLDRHLRPGG